MRLFVQIQAHGVEFENAPRVLHLAVTIMLILSFLTFSFAMSTMHTFHEKWEERVQKTWRRIHCLLSLGYFERISLGRMRRAPLLAALKINFQRISSEVFKHFNAHLPSGWHGFSSRYLPPLKP